MISSYLVGAMSLVSLLIGLHIRRTRPGTYKTPFLEPRNWPGWILLALLVGWYAAQSFLKDALPQLFKPGLHNPIAWVDMALGLLLFCYLVWSWIIKKPKRTE